VNVLGATLAEHNEFDQLDGAQCHGTPALVVEEALPVKQCDQGCCSELPAVAAVIVSCMKHLQVGFRECKNALYHAHEISRMNAPVGHLRCPGPGGTPAGTFGQAVRHHGQAVRHHGQVVRHHGQAEGSVGRHQPARYSSPSRPPPKLHRPKAGI
jgi:hypothetical protein